MMTAAEWKVGGDQVLAELVGGDIHFTAREVAPVGRLTKGVPLAVPPREVVQNAGLLIHQLLEWLRAEAGAVIDVNSWYRDPADNAAVGGAPRSLHLTGAAADVNVRGLTPPEVALLVHHQCPISDQLGIGLYRSFVHLDVRGLLGRKAPARWGTPGLWWTT